jgi:hypothetical protein
MSEKSAMSFFKDGAPKYVRCYKVKRNQTVDRYTIVFTWASRFIGKDYIGASGNPTHPLGFYQHGEAQQKEFHAPGSRVAWLDLPEELRRVALADYCCVWEIYPVVDRYGNVVMAQRQKVRR